MPAYQDDGRIPTTCANHFEQIEKALTGLDTTMTEAIKPALERVNALHITVNGNGSPQNSLVVRLQRAEERIAAINDSRTEQSQSRRSTILTVLGCTWAVGLTVFAAWIGTKLK